VFGINIIFIAPPLILLLLAIVVGAWRFSKRGAKAATTSVVRIIVYGSFVLFILFMAVLAMYYSGGGH
jgi:cytochrome c oxidase assembly factor CtaG